MPLGSPPPAAAAELLAAADDLVSAPAVREPFEVDFELTALVVVRVLLPAVDEVAAAAVEAGAAAATSFLPFAANALHHFFFLELARSSVRRVAKKVSEEAQSLLLMMRRERNWLHRSSGGRDCQPAEAVQRGLARLLLPHTPPHLQGGHRCIGQQSMTSTVQRLSYAEALTMQKRETAKNSVHPLNIDRFGHVQQKAQPVRRTNKPAVLCSAENMCSSAR